MKSASRTVGLMHRRLGIPVLPEGANLNGKGQIRVFPLQRFEVVYMEGVMNILEAILRLHGQRGAIGTPRDAQVIELLGHPDALTATVAALVGAQKAIDSPDSTERSE